MNTVVVVVDVVVISTSLQWQRGTQTRVLHLLSITDQLCGVGWLQSRTASAQFTSEPSDLEHRPCPRSPSRLKKLLGDSGCFLCMNAGGVTFVFTGRCIHLSTFAVSGALSLSLYWPHTCIEVKAAAHSITRCSEYLPKSNWDRHPRFSTKSSLREFAESSQILSSFLAKGHLGFGSRCLTTRRKPWNLFLFLYFLLNLQNKIIIRAKALLTCQALWLKAFRSLTGDFVLGVWGLISLLQGGVRHRLQRPDCRGGLYLYVCDAAVPRALLHTQSLQTLLWNI